MLHKKYDPSQPDGGAVINVQRHLGAAMAQEVQRVVY